MQNLRTKFVKFIYADHNSSRTIQNKVRGLLSRTDKNAFILNVGSGKTRLAPNVKNLDIEDNSDVDIVGTAESMPIPDSVVDLIITQEVFEHIQKPDLALAECFRVLKPGGTLYFQVPFIIGYHPGPTDFIRFSKEGVYEFLSIAGFEINELEISVGGGTGFYRILVEFFAILFSGPIDKLYLPCKCVFALLFFPVKWMDRWFNLSTQRDRIPGGYYAIATKPNI